MKPIIACLTLLVFLSSCSNKRLVIMSKGAPEINEKSGTIIGKDGAGHEETSMSTGREDWKLESPAGKGTVDLKEKGLYVVNVKNDTIIGSFQNYVAAENAGQVVSQETVIKKLDSLRLLVEAKNISAANRNFYILPNSAALITTNIEAEIVGPYHKMTSAYAKDGAAPEVYRFYSIREIRETIGKLEVLTQPIKK
ncbi:MAG: hypothetical protein ACKOOA_00080 [Sediminibacterium sp.]